MSTSNEVELIQFIVLLLRKSGCSKVWTMPLIKYAYLADYYSYMFDSKSVTRWKWQMYHYGPWTPDAVTTIQEAVRVGYLQSETKTPSFDEGREYEAFYAYTVDAKEVDELVEKLGRKIFPNIKTRMAVEGSVRRFKVESKKLLHYVYEETSPVLKSKKGEILDFSGVQPIATVAALEPAKLSSEKLSAMKTAMEGAKSAIKKVNYEPPRSNYDSLYYASIESMDKSELEDFPDEGSFETISKFVREG